MVKLGAHMSIAGGFDKAIEHGVRAGCQVVQIFTKNSNQWNSKAISPDDSARFHLKQEETNVYCVASHTSYLINCASPDHELYEKSENALFEEVKRAEMLEIPLVVLHPGAHMGSGVEAGIERISECLNRVLFLTKESSVKIALETTAGQGSSIGSSFSDLAQIIAGVMARDRVVVCFDTCHVFAAGYDLRDKKKYTQIMRDFDAAIGIQKLKLFHLNDSKKECGERIDRHEHIGQGCIGIEGFRHILSDARFKDVPMILETPKGKECAEDKENLKILRSLIKA